MLPSAHRLTNGEVFRRAIRGGTRSGSKSLVVHRWTASTQTDEPTLVGFVVSKAVGNAVKRNLVKRRLREAMARRLDQVVPGAVIVVRALPHAAGATYSELARDLDRCLRQSSRSSATLKEVSP